MNTKKYGKGWFFESERHRLARNGVKTSKKSNKITKGAIGGSLIGGLYGGLVAGPAGVVYGGVMGSGIGAGVGSAFTKDKKNASRSKKKSNYSKITIENGNLNGSIVIDLDEIKKRHPVEALKISNENYKQLYDSGVKLKKNEDTDGDGIINIKDKKPLRPDYSKLSVQQQINSILYNPKKQQTDKEVLTIEIPRDKSQHLKFLKTYTKFKTKGLWKGIEDNNVQIEVEFKDSKDEKYGKRLINLFNTLNKDKIKENVLYVRTEPVEESSLR